jgi:HSP20 family protein
MAPRLLDELAGGHKMANEQSRDRQEENGKNAAQNDKNNGKDAGSGKHASSERGLARQQTAMRPLLPLASPFNLMRRFMEDLDLLLDGSRTGNPRAGGSFRGIGDWVPALEVFERDGKVVIRAEVPGLSKDQVRVEVDEGQLIISGERSQEHEERKAGFYQSERSYGSFVRVVPLPDGVDPDLAKATFAKGVLEIKIPAPRQFRARSVEISDEPETKAQQPGNPTSATSPTTSQTGQQSANH